jgi:hypothetical protein
MIEAGRKRAAHRHVDVDFKVVAAQNMRMNRSNSIL